MNQNWKQFNTRQQQAANEREVEGRKRLLTFVHDHPELTYGQYSAKANVLGIKPMEKAEMQAMGFCMEAAPDEDTQPGHPCYEHEHAGV